LILLEIIEKVAQKIAPGPAPAYNEAHVMKAIEVIGNLKCIGRIRLSKELGLGEGTTRTLLKHLKNEGLTKSSKNGISFSEEGKKLFSELGKKIISGMDIPRSRLTLGSYNFAILIRGLAKSVKTGMEQRDIAIKYGASGATTLIFSENRLSLPIDEEDLSESMPDLHSKLMKKFTPKENDVIIIGWGEDRKLAEVGAKMAAINLLKKSV
jgi:predicted transcriptional regulator